MIIPTGCLIHVVNKPVSARYGIPTMFDMLISDELQIGWNGIEPVVIVTFNERRTICKVFVVENCNPDNRFSVCKIAFVKR